MANYKMYPGSKEKDTPGGISEKQTSTTKKLFNTIVKSVGIVSGLGPAMTLGKKVAKFKKSDIKKANKSIGETALEAMGGISGTLVRAAGKVRKKRKKTGR